MIIGIQDEILRLNVLGLLEPLLKDKTTKTNILWATDAYQRMGPDYQRNREIRPELITGEHSGVIRNRARKALEQQSERTKQHAEVATPLWVCKKMNDYADEPWFKKCDPHPFDRPEPVQFLSRTRWWRYVDARRLEITCGEAPYLVSRYDVSTGESIPIEDRVGILDRKLRVVGENTTTEEDWLRWALRAYQATYGYEFQGDNVLIARVNLLMTFEEYLYDRWKRKPTQRERQEVLNVIVWNIWQMDGLTGAIPYCREEVGQQIMLEDWPKEEDPQIEMADWWKFNDEEPPRQQPHCRIFDWRAKKSDEFLSLSARGNETMKFSFVIGNPPYQEERQGTSKTALPIYHKFLENAYQVGDRVEMIHPARFLFNAGRTPKNWNEKMLTDSHLKVMYYEQDGSKIFPNTDIKGGVAITYHDVNKEFTPIGVFTVYPELNSILAKVKPVVEMNGAISSIIFVATKFNAVNLCADFPAYAGHERRMSSNVLTFDCFHESKDATDDIMICGVRQNKRQRKYIKSSYVELLSNIYAYKIILPKADGNGKFGDTLTMPEILPPQSGFTHTFMGVGEFASLEEATSALKYIKSKFARALLSVLKVTQDNNADKWNLVPLQDFTPASDIDWSTSIPEIDQQLYAKYGLDEEEIAFIESHVKEMS